MTQNQKLKRENEELREELRKARVWLGFKSWKDFNYTYNDYDDCYYIGGSTKGVQPFSPEYSETDLRRIYAKENNL